MGNPLQTLHKSLLKNNYDVPEDYNSFERTLTAKGDEGYQNRLQLWKSLRDNDYDVPDNYDDFRDTLFTAKQPEPATYKPTAREMAGFQQTIGQATQAGQGATAAYDRRASNLQKRQGLRAPKRVTLGESNNLVEGEQHLNPETGELEQSYITSAGNEYQNKTIADQEQRQIDQAMRDERYRKSLPGQLDDAYAERDRLNAELAQHQGQWVDQDGRVHYGNRGDDESVAALEAALRQNQQRITALEAERDDDGGTQFWRGFVDAAMDPSVQTFGLTDFNDMVQLMRVKQKMDQAHDAGQEPELSSAEQKLIESTFLNNDAQQKYGENRGFMYRAGGISMQALPFVAEFMTTGGFSALSEAGAKYGAKAAEKLALDGLSKMFVKNLGVLAGDVAAGWAMANTTGAFRTASDIMQRNMGEVTINPEGQYDFGSYDEEGNFTRGGKSLGRSIYEAEVANTLEYYTEKLGEHLQLGKWIAKGAEKMGLSKLSKAVNYLSSSKWLESGGIQDYPSEVVEEQANLLLNAMLVGDNNFSLGPIKALSNDVLGTDFKVDRNSKEYKESVFNGKTQGDIWGGMMFSIGLMQAPRLAYTGKSAINYYQAKKTVDMADTNASIVFGEDNWASVKQQIDDCDNEQMGDMIASIATGDMNSTEKTAALNYAGDLLKMRGYNMGMMADAKDEQSSMSEEAIVSQSIDQSYGQGYNAQVPDEMKQIVDDAQASGEMLSSFGEEFSKMVMDGQEEPVQTMNYLMQNRDLYTDEQIAAAADYFQKQAAANGVMDAALDNVDMQVEQANAQIRGNAHQESGNLVMAKMGDQDYYVVGGEITPDGALVGTGGAVLLKDPVTGEVSVQSPANVMVYEMTPADELIQQNETVLRQQLTQQADDDINFGSPANEVFDMEDTVTLNDGNGGVIEGQVVQLPNAVDGVFVIQTNDGRALQMTADDMNRRIVAHNGVEVERASMQPDTETIENQQLEQMRTESVPTKNNQIQPQPQPEQGGETAGGEASAESGTGANEQPASALSRIPVKTDASGQPVKGKNGKPVLEWHKATVEDAASALIETAGGDMLTARDTASDLVNVARGKLEKIRKQKPKGEDPIEIAESRQAIKQQEQEQQAIIKQWQDVNQDIQRRMQAEAAERQAAIEAAKSEEQRQREAEEARKLKEQQEEQDRKRLREQIEKDKERRNKQYEPLVQARREMADDAEALSVLEDIEPRSLDEYVSSLLRPHSMLWQDASDSERGLQTELGLKRSDMQRMMTLLGTKESGAKPFGQVVLDIHEGLPQGMKDMYTDEDVRNTLLDLFNEGSSTRMLHLTEEHRIEEARQMKEENQRRAEEAEMDAWAEAYHLTPEEREAFEAYMQEPPTLVEQEVINQIIADNEQNRTSPAVGEEPVSGAVPAGIEGSQSQVQTAAEAEGGRNIEEGLAQGEEAASNQPPVSDDDVAGGASDIKQALLSNSSDGHLAEQQDAVPDLLPTQENNASFESKGTENISNNQEILGKTSSAEEISAEEAQVDTNPSEGQKEAGNYQKGHIKIDGYDITIENPKGSIRRGTDASGKPWETEMHNTYGYIRGTEGVDGDHIDVFLSDNPTNGSVYVVDQVNPSTGEFDEHKVMYGFASEEEARQAYLSNYSEGWQGLGEITEVSREDFKKWVQSSHRKTKPFAEYKSVKAATKSQPAAKKTEKKPKEHKRIVSDDQMEELRKKLLEKFNQANAGIDVERMLIGAMYAVGKIERGVTKFADYAAQMVDEIGDAIRPYLKSFYNAVRDMPEAAPYRDQMDDAQTVEAFDVFNFDKGGKVPDAITKAGQVVKQQKAKKQVKKIMQEQPSLFDDMFADSSKEETKPAQPEMPALDKNDYRTYMTPAAREYFAKDPRFANYAHKELAFIQAAVWDEVIIPVEELKKEPAIIEAEARINAKKGNLQLTEDEVSQYSERLFDKEHGSASYRDGELLGYTGEVKAEKKAFIVVGRPAGGKSSVFADPISHKYSARIIDSDTVKPWLDGYDDGYGASYVHKASTIVAERALDMAIERGENVVIPRIGGLSVVERAIELRKKGYDVELLFNDVPEEASIMRAASRFAMKGRYLSLDYLTTIGDKVSIIFSNFVDGNIGDYERIKDEVQRLLGRSERLPGNSASTREGLRELRTDVPAREGSTNKDVQELVGDGQLRSPEKQLVVNDGSPIFTHAEWKDNNVPFGTKPVTLWNSNDETFEDFLTREHDDARNLQKVGEENRRGSDEVSSGKSSFSRSADGSGLESDLQERGNERQGDTGVSGSNEAISGSTAGQLRPVQGLTQHQPEQDRAERSGLEHSVENPVEAPNDGREVRDTSGGPSATSTDGFSRDAVSALPKHNNRRNNVGERGKDYAPLSPKARFNANVEAIKMMRELMDQGVEAPTKDQMEVLRQYSGWGGLGTYFNDDTLAENKTLRELLTEEEYHDAALSIKTAYYTPATVIDTLWDIAKAMGFKGGNVLEGSAGIGNIIGQMPKDMSRRSDIEAVELDPISGNILKLLYPDAKVNIQGFQDTTIRNGSVDLAITNVPFAADISVIDKVDKDLSRKFRKLHDFCIAKNIRKLKEGGIGIFITTSGTLDKSTQLREWITDEGQSDVIGAFRLNNKTFGGTPVTSDIIVVRKRIAGKSSGNGIDIAKASPLRVGTWTDKYGDDHQVSMTINDYFKQHPEMMAGEMAFAYEKGETFRPGSYGLYPVEGKDQDKMLKKFVKRMQEVGASVTQQRTEQTTKPEQEPNQLTAVKEGRMLVDDKGRLCVSQYGEAVPLNLNDTKVKGYTKKQCFEDYQAVQKAVDDVLQQQLNDPDDTALEPKLDVLNKAFDQFVKRYGNLHKNTAISFLRNDIDFPSFQALENYSETKDMKGKVTVTTSKTPLFRQRVLGFKTEPQPKTVKDALVASVFRSNGIDLDWIAEKLGKDREEVRKGIIVSRLGFEDPSTGQLEISYKYLSGNVREKLAIAEAYNTDGRYNGNIEELRKVIPMDIPAHLIDFSLGSSWIPVEMYKDYLKENYDLNNVKLAHVEGSWVLDPQYSSIRNEKNRSAGVYSEQFRETIYGHQLVAAALNNRPVKVAKQVSEGYGSSKTTKTIVDQKATQACSVRVDEIKDDFKQWAKKKMQEDPELSQRIEKIYNDKFNALVPMEISDEFLPDTFENANVNIHLYGHQKRGVMRGVTTPTMLAHEVGTGKSFTLITTAMEMRRLGTAQKPMIVVQNATVAQMTADAKLLYPNAKILSLSEKDRSAEGRRAFYAKIKYNDWDLIIVPQSTFERIPDSPERELQFIQEKIDEKKHVIEAAEAAGMDDQELKRLKRELEKYEQEYGDKYLDEGEALAAQKKKKKDAKKEATSLDKAETRAKEQLDRAVDDVQYFDDMGVDALLVDEAHEYKHLGFQTSIGRGIKGVDPSYSKKCAGLYNKTRSVFEKAGWKNVVFATGTPISNTAAEIWTFMKYLMPADVMRANDIYYFDDFVHNFGSIQQMLEFTTSGKFKENTRFAAYVNKPELIRIWSQVADTVLTKEVGAVNAKIPDEEGGKDQDKFLPQSPSLISIMAAVRKELERFEDMSGQEKKENSHIPLTMYGIAKRAAIDPRLVNRDAPDEPLSKTNAAVKEIVQDLKDTESYKGTVAVFCDNQNRKNEAGFVDFNIFEDMRDKLIAQGVPAEQIVIIKSGMSIAAKQKVFDAVNSGGIRVVLGSTQTLGTGVNMQERLHLLIHMDAPDRPMDYTQRNGRIKRQGNLHKQWGKTIRVIRFGVEDSLDVTAYQRLKTKSGFIDSIMDGKTALANNQVDRTVEEEEEGLFDNPVAVLSGSQYALKKNQAERELRKYQGKKAQHEADQVYVTNTLRYNKAAIEGSKADIAKEQKQLERIKSMFPDGKVKTITVDGVKVDMTKDSGYGRLSEVIKEKINDPVNAIVKRNRENQIYNDETLTYTIELDGHPVNFQVDVTRTSEWDGGKMRNVIHKYTTYSSPDLQISNSLNVSKGVRDHLDEILEQVVTGNDYQDRITAMQQRIERMEKENEQLQKRVGLDFPYEKELKEAEKRVDEYTELMKKELEEKEAKYASQQTESVDLSSAEDNEEDEDLRFSADEDEDPIYSDAFKNWFGDWENDPGNASKVVDKNGMPLVLFHATNLTMVNHSEPFWSFYEYSHFGTSGQAMHRLGKTPEKMDIDLRAAQLGVTPMKMELTKTYAVYLNIRNPKRVEDVPEDWDETHSEWWGMQIYQAVREGYDGIVYENKYEDPLHPADSWIAFSSEQIKSATDNVGTYDSTRKDIRYREQERFEDGQLFPIHTSEVFSSYNVLGRRIAYSTDLMPDEYTSEQSLLDAVRNQYPEYFATIEDGSVKMESWSNVMKEAAVARQRASQKSAKNFIERKTRNAIDAVTYLAERMNLNVEVLTTTEGLTGKKARAKGWFNSKTGKITLVLPNHSNQSDLINTLLHEGVAHFGLRKMFGADFNTFLDNVYNNVSPEIKARIDAAIKRNGWSRHEATEEYLARLAERTDFEHAAESGWWQKIKDFFFEMLGKAGFNTSLTDNELRYILWRSYDNLLHPDSRRNIFDKAREVQMQSRLRVGPYSERERQRIQRTGRTDTSWVVAEAESQPTEQYLTVEEAKTKIEELSKKYHAVVPIEVTRKKANDRELVEMFLGEDSKEHVAKIANNKKLLKLMADMVRTKMEDFKAGYVPTLKKIVIFADELKADEYEKTFFHENIHAVLDQHYGDKMPRNIVEHFWKNAPMYVNGKTRDSIQEEGGYTDEEMPEEFFAHSLSECMESGGLLVFEGYLKDDADKALYHKILNEIGYDIEKEGRERLLGTRSSGQGFERAGKELKEFQGDEEVLDDDLIEFFSLRTKEPPKKTGIGYKVFVLKDGQLYPPMVANPGGEGTPVGVWLDADAAPVAGTSKTGRPQVKAGGKGTQGGSGQLAYRPGWHLGTIPYALQFNRKDANGERTLFPNNFVWAEVEYADDVDYQDEARQEGINANGKYQHSLAGLKHVPTDGSYKYRTNPDPRTDEWIITGAMRVNKILNRDEVDNLVRQAGREPQPIQAGDILTQEAVDELNAEIQSTKEADEMGLLMRDDSAWDDVAKESYEKEVATKSLQWQESWQDSMASLKAIQDAIAKESGHVATGAEDAYRYENRMHGRAKNMTEQYDWRFYRPMLKAFGDFCKAKGLTHERGMDYLIAKSGLERNVYYAFRDAVKSKLAEDIKDMREKLEKDYSKNRIDEKEYKSKKADIDLLEQTGVDDRMQQVRGSDDYLQAKEDYAKGDISYNDYLTRIEDIIRRETDDKYDEYLKDYSGLTETFNKEMYDAAQQIKKQAQRTIDPQERRELWGEYDAMMKQAYELARQEAEKRVFDAEQELTPDGEASGTTAQQLWEKINAATEETLKHSYESGLMERNTYNKVRKMFDFYLPLRGWDENKASDVYTYMGRENVFSPAVKKTWGRTSKAEDPLAYIGNIAVSTILSGHRNMMKQHFLNYVMNNPTSLVSISESWYENIGTEDDRPVWVLRSADTAGKDPDEIAQIVSDFNEEMRLKQNEGKAIPVRGRLRLDVNATQGQKAEHVVEVQRAGRTYQLYINGNPKAAQALNGSTARAVSRISDTYLGRKLTALNRSMAAFFTSKNPAFVVSNLSRDLNMAGASVAINEGADYNARFIANVVKVLSPRVALGDVGKIGIAGLIGKGRGVTGLMPKLMSKWKEGKLDAHDETERLFKEFMDEGGETGFVNMLSVESFKEKMRKEIAQMNGSSLFGSKGEVKEFAVTKALRMLGDTFEFYNRCAEDATRFIVYMTSRQMGKTLEQSIADAKDVTLNFNRKGTGDMGNAEVRDLFIFVNPAIQALANMYRMAKGHPLKFGIVTAGFVVAGAMIPVINQWLLNMFGDDDDKDAYWNLPPWVRKNNLVFWVPGTKNFVTMPLAQEFRVFYGVGEMISSGVMDHPLHNAGLEVVSSVADLVPINPTGNGGNLLVDFAPTGVQPIVQIGENVDFTGKPIWKDNQGNKFDPMFSKAYVSTPKWMVKISEGINSVTGGDQDIRGWLERNTAGAYLNNPAVWNHLLQGYFGGMYNTIAKTFDVAVTVGSGEAPKVYQTPILNRFLNRPVERDNAGVLGEEYWKQVEDAEETMHNIRKKRQRAADGDAEAQQELEDLLQTPDGKKAETVLHYKSIIDVLRKGERSATEKADKQLMKESISNYAQQMHDELMAIDGGLEPLDAAMQQFEKAKTIAEKKKLQKRIEKLMTGGNSRTGSASQDVDKAKQFVEDSDAEAPGADNYLNLATAEDIKDDGRIKAAKALAKPYLQHYKELNDAGKTEEASQYRQDHQQWFVLDAILKQQTRLMNQNKKLLGKGHDAAIMKLISNNRNAMLRAIDNNK